MKLILFMYLCISANLVTAGVITGAQSVISSPTPIKSSFTASNTIDQSGLSSHYISGVTDFDAYLSSSPTHTRVNTPNPNYFISTASSGNIDFNMGSMFSISKLALWNYPFDNSAGILNFDVFTSNVSDFSILFLVGSFSALDANGSDLINTPQIFDLTDSTAQFIRLSINSSFRGDGIGFSEIAFGTSAVPLQQQFGYSV